MAGEYGIAQGITQGLQTATQGMVQADTIQSNREARRQAAEKQNIYMQTAQIQQDTSKLQLQEMQMKLQEMEKTKAKDDAFNAFNAYEETGDTKYLNFAVEKNPLLKQIYTNNKVVTTTSIKDLSAEKLKELGYEEGKFVKPIVVTKTDGTQEIQDLVGTYATTGYLKEMRKDKLESLVNTMNENKLKNETAMTKLNTNLIDEVQAKVDAGEITVEEAWKLIQNKGKTSSDATSSLEKEAEYIRANYGEDAANQYIAKKTNPNTDTATMKNDQYKVQVTNELIKESGATALWDVNYDKLSTENKPRFAELARVQAKDIKAEERDALFTLSTAAGKLNVDDLKNTTGIADATLNSMFDRLGLDLPTKDLVQSANYNLIKNSIIRAAMGTQVTGNEIERINAQLGTEFRADKTVRVKMAETLDSLIGKYESYKVVAPAFYGYAMKQQVENMTKMSNYLKSEDNGKGTKETKPKKTQAPIGTEIRNISTGVVQIMTEEGWKNK